MVCEMVLEEQGVLTSELRKRAEALKVIPISSFSSSFSPQP